MKRIKEFFEKLLSIKVVAFSLIFGVSVSMLTTGKLTGGEWMTGTIALYGLLIGGREFSKLQQRRFPDVVDNTSEHFVEDTIGFIRERGE